MQPENLVGIFHTIFPPDAKHLDRRREITCLLITHYKSLEYGGTQMVPKHMNFLHHIPSILGLDVRQLSVVGGGAKSKDIHLRYAVLHLFFCTC